MARRNFKGRRRRKRRRRFCAAGLSLLAFSCRPLCGEAALFSARYEEVDATMAATSAAEFHTLWEMVVIRQESRDIEQGRGPPVKQVCLYGLSNSTLQIAGYLLGQAQPPIDELEIFDAAPRRDGAPRLSGHLLSLLEEGFGSRVRRSDRHGSGAFVPGGPPSARQAGDGPVCDMVVFSKASPRFSIDRVLPHLGEHVVVVWVSDSCVLEQGENASPTCNFLNTFWISTKLILRGYCSPGICMARIPTAWLKDPNTVELDCDAFTGQHGTNASLSEYGQDWFVWWNFFRPFREKPGLYVDVGASLPFDYSNTVLLDRCLGWQGVCVEPNPHILSFLQAYRSCTVFPNCIDEEKFKGKAFSDRNGQLEFTADCLPLGEVLARAGLKGRRIDLLTIDVEHHEMGVLRSVDLDEFDVRFIVIEVTRGATWLEVDSYILPKGYAKIAVLGRDVVYGKLAELRSAGFADWQPMLISDEEPRTLLPNGYAKFHQRVIDEEVEEEMRRERRAMYAGLRRR